MQSRQSIKKLKALALEANRRKYPNFPEYARVTPSYTDKDANGLTKCIIDYIRMTGGQAERISVTGRKINGKKVFTDAAGCKRQIGKDKYIKSNMRKGSADISATIAGRSVKIEVKIGKDRQSQAQREYEEEIKRAGGIYFIAKSFDDFLEKLEAYDLEPANVLENY